MYGDRNANMDQRCDRDAPAPKIKEAFPLRPFLPQLDDVAIRITDEERRAGA
jgi:hypothetical protein